MSNSQLIRNTSYKQPIPLESDYVRMGVDVERYNRAKSNHPLFEIWMDYSEHVRKGHKRKASALFEYAREFYGLNMLAYMFDHFKNQQFALKGITYGQH